MADVTSENHIELTKENDEIENVKSAESPKQQSEDKTPNSHLHDSEYDTANYDTSDEDAEESLEEENCNKSGEDLTSTDSEEEEEEEENKEERQRGDGQEQIDLMKKVDEDRSNPQYIPKKGTFYEHDDRTTENPETVNTNVAENNDIIETNPNSVTPTISSASKTMKKWQPASVGRWSHDRFEETEQAPKSRSELVSAYGYDIRNEDGPPRARRRRRYGRGPTKYNRNWEDESAYIKANNLQRKQLRPEDFPILGDRKFLVKNGQNFKEEKENHYENRRTSESGNANIHNEKKNNGGVNGRNNRTGRRKSIDFQNRNRSKYDGNKNNQHFRQIDNSRVGSGIDKQCDNLNSQMEKLNFANINVLSPPISASSSLAQQQRQEQQQLQNVELYNNSNENYHANQSSKNRENIFNSNQHQQQSHNDVQTNNLNSKLNTRIQHAQQRNDPSHVGSVQMHSLASSQKNLLQNVSDHRPLPVLEQGKMKRYSNIRQRSLADSTTIVQQRPEIEKLNIQQIQLQQDMLPQEHQHVLLYHPQDPIQMQSAQLQNVAKNVPPSSQFQQNPVQPQYPPGSSYYSEEYGPGSAVSSVPIIQLTSPAAAYIQQQQPSAASQVTNAQPPSALNYVQPSGSAPDPANSASAIPYQNYPSQTGPASQYPNYNTVGGTTYFVPHVQPSQRTNAIQQRRPTNAIPILAPPSDKCKQSMDQNQIESFENIDHILDNMFVQRAPFILPQSSAVNSARIDCVDSSVETLITDNTIKKNINNILVVDNNKIVLSDPPIDKSSVIENVSDVSNTNLNINPENSVVIEDQISKMQDVQKELS